MWYEVMGERRRTGDEVTCKPFSPVGCGQRGGLLSLPASCWLPASRVVLLLLLFLPRFNCTAPMLLNWQAKMNQLGGWGGQDGDV